VRDVSENCEKCKYRGWSEVGELYWCEKWEILVIPNGTCKEYEADDRKIAITDGGKGKAGMR